MNKDEERIRNYAKQMGISNWWNKRLDNIQAEIDEMEGSVCDATESTLHRGEEIPKLTFGMLMDFLDEWALERLGDSFEAMDHLSSHDKFAKWLDYVVWTLNVESGVSLDWLYNSCVCLSDFRFGRESFEEMMRYVCSVYDGCGWTLNNGYLYFDKRPHFRLGWHLSRWKETNNSKSKQMAYRVFAILLGGDVNGEE